MFIQLAIDLDILQQGVKQWGLIPESHTVNFPVPFKNIFSITVSGNEIGNGNVPVWGMLVVNTTNSTATADVRWKYIAAGIA